MKKYFLLSILALAITFLVVSLCGTICNAQLNIALAGNLLYSGNLSNIWSMTDSTGKEYALVGAGNGLSVVDVTVPTAPKQVYFKSQPQSTWREVSTWKRHAYVTTEATHGLLIVDLSKLPDTTFITTKVYNGVNFPFTRIHALHIDEKGILYIFGTNYNNGVGTIVLDVNTDPKNPVELGAITNFYIHDGFVRGDTLWAAAINNGFIGVFNMAVKSNPVLLTTFNTPNTFSHNCWLSANSKYLFTTDEVVGAYVTSYDVSDLSNVKELDRFRVFPTDNIPHNTYFLNNYLITSDYGYGVVITDATYPHNLIEVGNFDTSPAFAGGSFNGCWGVNPFLPSGNLVASDMEKGLYVLVPTYKRACYLEGLVNDSVSGAPLSNVSVQIITNNQVRKTGIDGKYSTGIATAGTYSVQFSRFGYVTKVLSISLSNSVLSTLNVQLAPDASAFTASGQVKETFTGGGIAGAVIIIADSAFQYNLTSDSAGGFSANNIVPGNYDVYAGKWGFVTKCISGMYISSTTGNIVLSLDKGYMDDFTLNFGWTETGDATNGKWERGKPVGTDYNGVPVNPGNDVNMDCSDKAYITGNGGGGAGDDDIDNGTTVLTSPVFNLTGYNVPFISYFRWFFDSGGFSAPNDTLIVMITSGTDTAVIEKVIANPPNNSLWINKVFKISNYVAPGTNMRLILKATDYDQGHLVEAGLDMFQVYDSASGPLSIPPTQLAQNNSQLQLFPNPFSQSCNVIYQLDSPVNDSRIIVSDVTGRIIEETILKKSSGELILSNFRTDGVYFVLLVNNGVVVQATKVINKP